MPYIMKNRKLIVIVSFICVLICLMYMASLMYTVPPSTIVKIAFTIGLITGTCVTLTIYNLVNIIRENRLKHVR